MRFERLCAEFAGEVFEDAFTRGRYAPDASVYQIMPAAVAMPRDVADVQVALAAAYAEGVSVTARGGGTSQCGQTVNHGLILDNSRHLGRILEIDVAGRRAVVEPGLVLDALNRALKPHGLWFPVDVSTASRATIGGMAANNSCGGRSLRYGTMRDNVRAVDAVLADGATARFGPVAPGPVADGPLGAIAADMLRLGAENATLVEARFPKLNHRVGGYSLDALTGGAGAVNMASLLVGSEGTLAYFTSIELRLWPLMGERVLAVCHFPTFRRAMEAAPRLVALGPIAVELVDDTMIGLSRQIPIFRRVIDDFVRGEPAALLLVEFDEGSAEANAAKLVETGACLDEFGLSWSGAGHRQGGVASIVDPRLQAQIAEVRKAGLNIMMSMKQEGKPVSFVEGCAVPLGDLADYTERLTEVFARHGARGTWYAHASDGCLHVRPVLDMKRSEDVGKIEAARAEARRLVDALLPHVRAGAAVVGLEPLSLLTLRDEIPSLLPGGEAREVAERALLLEEFIVERAIAPPLRPLHRRILLHGHCHQKAHGAMPAVRATLEAIPGARIEIVETSCCGMAGAFGYGRETHDVSMRMAEADLLPAIRAAGRDVLVAADGFSCRHQIVDGAGRQAHHVAAIVDMALAKGDLAA